MLKKVLVLGAIYLFAAWSHAAPTCDFKGISVGDKLTRIQAMSLLQVQKFKLDLQQRPWEQKTQNIDKFGLIGAAEIDNWEIGPHCDKETCRIPYGIEVGNKVPVSVFIAFDKGTVTSIEVSFNELHWEEVLQVINLKYGTDWTIENIDMPIMDTLTKKTLIQNRVLMQHRLHGRNPKTGDRCSLAATNFDIIFTHHDPLGTYHSIFSINLISRNF